MAGFQNDRKAPSMDTLVTVHLTGSPFD